VQKQLTIACGAAELPALVWDSKKFYDARKAAGTPGELVVIGAPTIFTILEELRRADRALAKVALSLAPKPR
jgi:arylformamidase